MTVLTLTRNRLAERPTEDATAIRKVILAPKSVRPAEAAVLLGVCRDTVYTLMRAGLLRSVKAGRARLIPITAIEEFLASEEEVGL